MQLLSTNIEPTWNSGGRAWSNSQTNGEGGWSYLPDNQHVFYRAVYPGSNYKSGTVYIIPAIVGCGCAYLCAATNQLRSSVVCICPSDFKLGPDGKSCICEYFSYRVALFFVRKRIPNKRNSYWYLHKPSSLQTTVKTSNTNGLNENEEIPISGREMGPYAIIAYSTLCPCHNISTEYDFNFLTKRCRRRGRKNVALQSVQTRHFCATRTTLQGYQSQGWERYRKCSKVSWHLTCH